MTLNMTSMRWREKMGAAGMDGKELIFCILFVIV